MACRRPTAAAAPRTPKGRAREVARRLAAEYPGRRLRARPRQPLRAAGGHDPVGPDHRRAGQHGDAGAVRPLPDAGRPRRAPTRPTSRSIDPLDRLLPQQDQEPHRHGPGARRALRRRGADRAWRTSSRCPASAARRPTWCAAWPSTCPGSRSTPTSAGCRRRLGLTDRGRPGEGRARAQRLILPPAERGRFSLRLILHGRRVCIARRPRCEACVLDGHLPVVAGTARPSPSARAG